MSNHFTYEIDERNIRLQLKGFKIEAKEEDWQRFQGHSSENYNFRQGIKVEDRFNITLNRNVVLPVVFGIIILVFSLLLVNFMSIKNTPKSVTVTPDKIEDKPQSDLKVSPQPTKSNIQVQQQTSPEVALLVPSIETTTITPTEIQTPQAFLWLMQEEFEFQ